MIEFMKQPFNDEDIENIVNMQKAVEHVKSKRKEIEYNDQMKLKPEFRKEEYKRKRSTKKPMGNKFWKPKLIDGKWIKVPVEPDNDEINEVFIDGRGYVPVTRVEDIKNEFI